ncbi:hypothetical protein [Desulfofundulus salinus]|uniref:hypothetical protein n=1 Tax=Desulfofundulus salinus TaxID=2419843 RepID=UPI001402C41F|nr:hypothetical protein [Desulfofundulus salinum]
MLFWIFRSLWYVMLLHDLVFLPLFIFLFLRFVGIEWKSCPAGPVPHGYVEPVLWLQFLSDWNRFGETGQVAGVFRVCLTFYLLLLGADFILPAVLVPFARALGRWVKSMPASVYLDCLTGCSFILVPLLGGYAAAAWFATTSLTGLVVTEGNRALLLLWACFFAFYTLLVPYNRKVYHWHAGLWWRFITV